MAKFGTFKSTCCKDCTVRYIGCHSSCNLYINAKMKLEEIKVLERNYKMVNMVTEFEKKRRSRNERW